MKTFLSTTALCFVAYMTTFAHQDVVISDPYQTYFEEAYVLYPDIPRGVLEAVAFNNTHFNHLTHPVNEEGSCTGMPKAYGVMGLILDGKAYFNNNLEYIARLSGYSKNDILDSPEKNILAFAKAYNTLAWARLDNRMPGGTIAEVANTLTLLSELPHQTAGQQFALLTQMYGYLSFMSDFTCQARYNFPDPGFDLPAFFGDNYPVLSSSSVTVSSSGISDHNGNAFKYDPQVQSPDYGPAIWNPAASCNYSNGRSLAISAVTIHDIEGSYAGAISWFQNCAASVSAHYVVRSSDGQITQMVLESNTAWHVGSENSYTVGIEHEGYASQSGWYTTAMYTASAALVADICSSHSIDPGRTGFWPWLPTTYYNQSSIPGSCCKVKGHMHFPNQTHNDPGPYWDWDYFYKLINPQPAPTTYTAASGTIYDSGGPSGNYSDDERSVWVIAPANATQVTVTFNSFNVENTWDYVYIYDGTDVWAPLIGYWTGTNSPGTVTANSGSMTIEFRSDCSTNASGWNASYTSSSNIVVPANLSVAQNSCPQMGVTLNWNNSGTGWYVDVSTDPNFSTFYNKNVDNLTATVCPGSFCDYPNCTGYLKFEPGTTYYWRIWNGSTQTYGSSFATPVCSTTDASCSGTIFDSGGPSGTYSGNEDYTYTIAPSNASSVTLNFSAFDLEANFDSLYIYDGPTENDPVIGAYTGTGSPGTVTSTGGAVTLHFISDPFVNNNGFAATWTCTQLSTGTPETGAFAEAGLYPNPAHGGADLHYSLNAQGPVTIRLVDMLGRVITLLEEADQASGAHSLYIDLNRLALSKGMYDVQLISISGSTNLKLIVN
jgi:hypothetical protein